MKKASFILNIVFLLVTVFFILYARIQTKLAEENAEIAMEYQMEAQENAERALQEATNSREAEAYAKKAQLELELCKTQNQ